MKRNVWRMAILGSMISLCANAATLDSAKRDGELHRHHFQRTWIEKSVLVAAFAKAYSRYPALPMGSLEALAFTATRGQWLAKGMPSHAGMPVPAGVMALHRGEKGFADLVGEASALTGLTRDQIETQVDANVMAAAALLMKRVSVKAKGIRFEDLADAFRDLSGIRVDGRANPAIEYARTSHAYDVLLAADRGNDDGELKFAPVAIEYERAFEGVEMKMLRAPMLRLDVNSIREMSDIVDPISETVGNAHVYAKSTDYAPALWVASPNFSARNNTIQFVAVHDTEGSYAGAISWFQNSASNVSAHYVIRSSDGQITQMVRDAQKAWHIGIHNPYTLGIEHEGFAAQTGWYTTAMYTASAKLTKNFCVKYALDCTKTYKGPSSSGANPVTGYSVKGHQHYSSQTHVDPGINWNWTTYYNLINGVSSVTTVLDNFETSEGHFNTAPAYSGSSVGIAITSTSERSDLRPKNGLYSERLVLNDNTASSAAWAVRFLSGSGDRLQNTAVPRATGRIGFWAYASTSGVTVALGVDDSDGTERSNSKSLPSNVWTYVEWSLSDTSLWNAWSGGNGAITAATATLDAIWFFHAGAATPITLYVDDVQMIR